MYLSIYFKFYAVLFDVDSNVLDKVTDLISERGGNTLIRDQRPEFKKISFKFSGELQSSQKNAVKKMMETEAAAP